MNLAKIILFGVIGAEAISVKKKVIQKRLDLLLYTSKLTSYLGNIFVRD